MQHNPFLSIIIATRNEEKYIGKLLDSIVKQTYPKQDFEVLIVDGLSKDRTLEIVNSYKQSLDVKVLSNPKIRAPSAFNLGLDKAIGNYFVIIGAHSYLKEDFVEESVKTFLKIRKEEPMLAAVGGICKDEYESTTAKISSLLYRSSFSGARTCRFKKTAHFSDSVIFGLFEKKVVTENGKFDEDFLAAGDDDELTVRLFNRGYKFFTNPSIISHYYNRSSFTSFLKQTFNYGVAKGFLVRKTRQKPDFSNLASLSLIPAGFFLYEILVCSVLFIFGFSLWTVLVPFIVYWVFDIGVSLRSFKLTKARLCLLLPVVYFMFHNILGLSSLLGMMLKKRAFL